MTGGIADHSGQPPAFVAESLLALMILSFVFTPSRDVRRAVSAGWSGAAKRARRSASSKRVAKSSGVKARARRFDPGRRPSSHRLREPCVSLMKGDASHDPSEVGRNWRLMWAQGPHRCRTA